MASGTFIYPSDRENNEDFQYLDLVNVSWTSSGLGSLDYIGLTLYLMNNGESSNYQVPINASNLPHTGWTIWPLNFVGVAYPAVGHYGITYNFQNGTIAGGPNMPVGFNVLQQSNGTITCWNCSLSDTSSATVPGSTAQQSNGGANLVANSSATSSSSASNQGSDGIGAGAGAGIAIGAIVAIAMLGMTIFWCYGWNRRRRQAGSEPLLMPRQSPRSPKKSPPHELRTRPTMRVPEMMASPIGRELSPYGRHETYEMETRAHQYL